MHPFDLSVETAVRRARDLQPHFCFYVSTRFDDALEEARNREGPLAGVPYGLKDAFDTPHLPTTGGSWRYRDRTPDTSSAPYRAFEAAGAVLLGKSNLSDLGLAPEATSYVGGAVRNPFDLKRTAGGSSGGSAAAVACGVHGFDWGTDIGGSIRLPAAFCAILGLKLSHATWPLQELFPPVPKSLRSMCGQGPFTQTTDQMRAVLRAAAPVLRQGTPTAFAPTAVALYAPNPGRWPRFHTEVTPIIETALDLPVASTDAIPPPQQILRTFVGFWASHFFELLDSDTEVGFFDGLGAVLSAVLTRGTLGDKRFHPMTAELLLLFALSRATWAPRPERAADRVAAIRRVFQDLWAQQTLIIAPAVAHPPPKLRSSNRNRQLLEYTCPGNLADATGLSVPFGTFDGGLPRSIQLIGPPGAEDALLDLADRIIAVRDRHPHLRPPVFHPPAAVTA